MWVKIPPSRRKTTPYLALLTRLGILGGKACNRAELEPKQIGALPLIREMSRVNRF